ncbi:MAG: PKD domain-containing protein [Thermoplasmatales archaeon]|nr:MAG: PKD domain-containing protein [Thermoplasmatales archaeon]
MRIFEKTKSDVLPAIIIGIIILYGTISVAGDEGDTIVSLDPLNQSASAVDTFNVNVSCTPGQPIKAFEFKLSFNPLLLQANSVTEGDIFDGYPTFFNAGIIDNNIGTIVDVFGLIMGDGNVTDSGTFVTISFTAKNASGTSSLDIYDVGVADEIGYVSIDVSDGSVDVQGPGDDPSVGGGSSGGGGGYKPPIVVDNDENNPPEIPLMSSGPIFVEMGVEYTYTSSAVDVDGDQIRFRFDWGDGNLSDWSDLVASNTLVSMSYYWSSIKTYMVRVIAQDENGLNSSWSMPLNVTVSTIDFEGKSPVADIYVPSNLSVNQTIVFDASGSFDEDGVIVSYYWDFGDGENGSGITTSHIYENPGEYTVTLVVTDDDMNTYSKSVIVTVVDTKAESVNEQGIIPFRLGMYILVGTIAFHVWLVVFFRDKH